MTAKVETMDLVQIDFDVVEITDEDLIKNGLADLKERFSVVSDPATKEGYEKNRAAVAIMRALRGKVTAKIKEKKAPHLKQSKKLEEIKKWMIGDITALEDPMKEKNKAHDEKVEKEKFEKAKAENERIDSINTRIEDIRLSPVTNMDKDSDFLSDILQVTKEERNELSWADEKTEQAQDVIGETITKLEQLIAAKKAQEEITRQQEAEAKRLEDEKKAVEEKAQAEREEQDRKNKEEADRLAKLKAEQDRVAKIESDKLEKERAEFEAEKKKAKDEQEARDRVAQEKEDARLAAIKKEDDERAAKFKAEQEEKAAKEKAEAERIAEIKEAAAKAEDITAKVDEVALVIQGLLESGSQPIDIAMEIVDGRVPYVTFAP